jgi:uncharacterized membrane protein YhhN
LNIALLPWLLGALCVTGLLWSETKGPHYLSWLFKPLAASCFIVLAVLNGAVDSNYGLWLLAGLCLCMAGDILLIPDSEACFKAGLTSFLLGHLLYAVAFLHLPWNTYAAGLAVLPVALLAVLALRWLQVHLTADMVVPVRAYILVISLMLLAASSTLGSSGGLWIAVGAWGFAFSDLAVARHQFIKAQPLNRLWGTPLYFGSQMLLALSPALI